MHLISHKDKSFYIHIPKNGGHTICPLLINKKWAHIPVPLRHNQLTDEMLEQYYVFTVVRNPYERFMSGWKSVMMSKKQTHNINPKFFKNNFNKLKDPIHIGMTQTQHLANSLNYLDKIYRFEDFEVAYDEVNEKFNCGGVDYKDQPKLNASKIVPIDEYMDKNVIDYINNVYENDFTNFDYKKL